MYYTLAIVNRTNKFHNGRMKDVYHVFSVNRGRCGFLQHHMHQPGELLDRRRVLHVWQKSLHRLQHRLYLTGGKLMNTKMIVRDKIFNTL